jgi:hypothetical protein
MRVENGLNYASKFHKSWSEFRSRIIPLTWSETMEISQSLS